MWRRWWLDGRGWLICLCGVALVIFVLALLLRSSSARAPVLSTCPHSTGAASTAAPAPAAERGRELEGVGATQRVQPVQPVQVVQVVTPREVSPEEVLFELGPPSASSVLWRRRLQGPRRYLGPARDKRRWIVELRGKGLAWTAERTLWASRQPGIRECVRSDAAVYARHRVSDLARTSARVLGGPADVPDEALLWWSGENGGDAIVEIVGRALIVRVDAELLVCDYADPPGPLTRRGPSLRTAGGVQPARLSFALAVETWAASSADAEAPADLIQAVAPRVWPLVIEEDPPAAAAAAAAASGWTLELSVPMHKGAHSSSGEDDPVLLRCRHAPSAAPNSSPPAREPRSAPREDAEEGTDGDDGGDGAEIKRFRLPFRDIVLSGLAISAPQQALI
jgi:hypothetical protein